MQLSRRSILIGTAVGGGLMLGYMLRPREFPLPLSPGRDEIAFDAWIKIARDGVISVAVPQIEMGQGISTLLPQIVAAELGADWRQIAVEPAPVSGHYANVPLAARWAELWMPVMPSLADGDSVLARRWAQDRRFMVTADGTSLEAYETPAREAAATVRALLSKAAAALWDVSWEECEAKDGFIVHGKQREPFASLAEDAAAFDPPDPPPLRPAPLGEQVASSAAVPRLDLPSKSDGSYLFAGDVRLPDMVFAAVHHGPVGKSRLSRYDRSAAAGTPGFIDVVEGCLL
ncbi:MAG: molybdopterin-dependent oxidoreductase, partial [Sphingomonadaceae bacterium]|nr:molybdopterin-dependent oxidoreductase [Sphingomonadaceae bacterium]